MRRDPLWLYALLVAGSLMALAKGSGYGDFCKGFGDYRVSVAHSR